MLRPGYPPGLPDPPHPHSSPPEVTCSSTSRRSTNSSWPAVATWTPKVAGALAVLLIGWMVAGRIRSIARRVLRASPIDDILIPFLSGMVHVRDDRDRRRRRDGRPGDQHCVVRRRDRCRRPRRSPSHSRAPSRTSRPASCSSPSGPSTSATTSRWAEAPARCERSGSSPACSTRRTTSQIRVPNDQIFGATIKNFSANDTRRIDLVMGVGYDDDLGVAARTCMDTISADPRVLADPAPQVAVAELADSSVNLVVRPWVKKEDYWERPLRPHPGAEGEHRGGRLLDPVSAAGRAHAPGQRLRRAPARDPPPPGSGLQRNGSRGGSLSHPRVRHYLRLRLIFICSERSRAGTAGHRRDSRADAAELRLGDIPLPAGGRAGEHRSAGGPRRAPPGARRSARMPDLPRALLARR